VAPAAQPQVRQGSVQRIERRGNSMPDREKQQERISYWLDIAQYDLETAEAMLKTQRLLYVGFMCHQVIEKTLKACYVRSLNATPPRHHNLAFFAKESGILQKLSEEQKTFIALLTPLNVESRYPTYKDNVFQTLTEERCRLLLQQTKEFFQWLRNQL
jgi:HEPN domain-containing protein